MDIEDVGSRADLARFLAALAAEAEAEHAPTHETVADFIEAASGWVADMDGYFLHAGENTPENPSWRLIGQIFASAMVYE
jgi:hypothetical protein